jgi:tetratricopeptide (TPR) repeat protein
VKPRAPLATRTGLAVAVALAALLAHARSAGFAFTDLDDRDLVVDDQAFLAQPANLVRAFGRAYMHVVDPAHAYYRPMVTVSYGLDALLSGARPVGYHLTNLALHAVASVLFLALLRRFAMPPAVACVVAIAFAVHPALATAVAWIPGRNDSLLAVFALAAWLMLLRDRDRPSRAHRALHLGFFALALLTKETAVALLLVWWLQGVLVDRGPPGPGESRGRRRAAVVYVAGWTALVGAAAIAHGALGGGLGSIRAAALARNLPQLFACLGKIVFPVDPTVLAAPEDVSPWPGVVAALGMAAGARFVRGARPAVVAFGMSAFGLLLLPVLAAPGTLVLDNRLYLPACGALLAVAEIVRAAAFERAAPLEPKLFVALSAVALLVLALFTAGYEESFRDPRAFARAAVAGAPHSPLAHFCLGKAYQTDGDDDRALAEYETSLALGPGEVVHNNIAVIHMAHARWADAESELREELEVDPRYGRAYDNLAIVLRHEGRDEESRAATETARGLEAE